MGDEVDSVGAGGGGGIGGGRRRGGRGRRERVSQAGLNGFACIQLIMQLLKVTAVYAVISALQNEKETCVEMKSTPERHTDRYRHRETEHDAVQGRFTDQLGNDFISFITDLQGDLQTYRLTSASDPTYAIIERIGPSTWNELPFTLRLLPQNNVSSFSKLVKIFLFDRSWIESASE